MSTMGQMRLSRQCSVARRTDQKKQHEGRRTYREMGAPKLNKIGNIRSASIYSTAVDWL